MEIVIVTEAALAMAAIGIEVAIVIEVRMAAVATRMAIAIAMPTAIARKAAATAAAAIAIVNMGRAMQPNRRAKVRVTNLATRSATPKDRRSVIAIASGIVIASAIRRPTRPTPPTLSALVPARPWRHHLPLSAKCSRIRTRAMVLRWMERRAAMAVAVEAAVVDAAVVDVTAMVVRRIR
jgi:hypothetical protein